MSECFEVLEAPVSAASDSSAPRTQEGKSMLKLQFELIVEEDGGRLYGRCEALKGLHVDGADEAELQKNAIEAIISHIDSMKRHNEPLPIGCIVRERPKASLFDRLARNLTPP